VSYGYMILNIIQWM